MRSHTRRPRAPSVPTLTWVVFASLALVAVGCSAAAPTVAPSRDASGSATASSPTAGTSPSPDASIPDILDFEAPLLGGGTFEGAVLVGKPVAMWFWAPW